ncbi:MAG: dodecin domain-containing protein [Elusimicrobia bacterium]|nr:dodecin domain-containing protein [Elusimicrobiota bacterium]
MSVVKVIEVLAQSDKSWEDAAEEALRQASRTVRNIRSLYIKEMQLVPQDGALQYRVDCKISFEVDPARHETERQEARGAAKAKKNDGY